MSKNSLWLNDVCLLCVIKNLKRFYIDKYRIKVFCHHCCFKRKIEEAVMIDKSGSYETIKTINLRKV